MPPRSRNSAVVLNAFMGYRRRRGCEERCTRKSRVSRRIVRTFRAVASAKNECENAEDHNVDHKRDCLAGRISTRQMLLTSIRAPDPKCVKGRPATERSHRALVGATSGMP